MAMINIPRERNDPFYRYKMPRLVITSYDKNNNNEIYKRCNACGNMSTMKKESHKLIKFILSNWLQCEGKSDRLDLDENTSIVQEEEQASDESEDWDGDLSSSAIESNIQLNRMGPLEDLHKQMHENCEQFNSLLKKKKLANQLNDPISIQELIIEAERLNIIEQAPFYVAECLFTDQIIKEIKAYKMLLYKESKQLVDKAIATEIREYAEEFIEWLRTAEESNDEDNNKVSNDL
ncbi:unnamed protein product [Rotaria sp. Silwood2]|nr:unnamed protein product [Rotaria sp. Silwood2]CAF2826524.1 unnamed protein product [Rotaria sp. Silwood2]CAF3074245.1 unnamed protein product [Rotaria sp. Silwood2]CAF3380001.1 unnamed protein product [Rotaria sp. Silwood2]CAF3956657.1 unnamed protein product [Rotaria sp. Silwood2]